MALPNDPQPVSLSQLVASIRRGYVGLRLPFGIEQVQFTDPNMIVHKNITKAVAFSGYRKDKTRHQINGTVFFVTHPIEGTGDSQAYVVTAKHVVEGAIAKSPDATVCLRVNLQGSVAEWLTTPTADWVFHDDHLVDVAILPVHWNDHHFLKHYDHLPISSDVFLTDAYSEAFAIGPGEDLYFPGLFARRAGTARNVPIVRTGTIAGLAEEAVRLKKGQTRVYLAEVRSIGGHSGSPVFVHFDTERLKKLLADAKAAGNNEFEQTQTLLLRNTGLALHPLLGMVRGHFPFAEDEDLAMDGSDDESAVDEPADLLAENIRSVNSGIAIITPATAILEVLNQKALTEQRRQEAERINSEEEVFIIED